MIAFYGLVFTYLLMFVAGMSVLMLVIGIIMTGYDALMESKDD